MAEYQPIKGGSSLATSTAESRTLSDSDEFLEVDDLEFASFKDFSDIEKLFVTFSLTQTVYKLDEPVVTSFYSQSSFKMNNEDIIGICPMRKSVPLVKMTIAQCEADSNPEAVSDEIFEEIIAKKATFNIDQLPSEFKNELYFQFCYFNDKSEMLGISTPFRFQKENDKSPLSTMESAENIVQLENISENYDSMMMEKRDDDDFIVVRSQESFLKERVDHLTKSNGLLEYLIRSLEKDLSNKTVELQQIVSHHEKEKLKFFKIKEEKEQAVNDFEDVSRKHYELKNSTIELKKLIQKEQAVNQMLQTELNDSKMKISKLEETFKKIQADEEMLKSILKDKEEEISYHKDLVANLEQAKKEYAKNIVIAEEKMLNLQSTLANALNERRTLMQEKNKYNDYDILTTENKSLKQRVLDLETVKEKQANEIKTLEDELRNSVANFNNLDSKIQAESSANALKEQKNALAVDKLKFELIEMQARLEQSRVEYGNLFRKYRSVQKLEKSKPLKASASLSRSSSITSNASLTTNLNLSPENKLDEIDLQLQQLDEEVKKDDISNREVLEKVASKEPKLLIDIETEQSHEESVPSAPEAIETRVEAHTSAKTLVSPSVVSSEVKDKTLVTMPCIMCDKIIHCRQHEDGSGQMHEMVQHLEIEHKQKMCPVCSTLFDTRLPIFSTYFANHIQNHFNSIKYPN